MLRTHNIGTLGLDLVGQTVTLTGWVDRRRDHGGVAFIDLRDASGIAQVVVRDERVAHELRSEFVLKVTGEVCARPEGNENPNLATGAIEVMGDDIEILNTSAPLPFQVSSNAEDSGNVCVVNLSSTLCACVRRFRALLAILSTLTISSKLKRRRLHVPPLKARVTSLFLRACHPVLGMRCRSLRSFSSRC